jgi:protein-disulfide isomerase
MQTLNRRSILVLGASALALSACKGGTGGAATADDMTMGDSKAKVTVVEYASFGCSHCGDWNREIFPQFKAKYIDTGKVFYVFREFLAGPTPLAVAGALLARCAGKDKYFTVADAVFHAQPAIFQTGDMRGPLLQVAQSAGMTEEQFQACVSDEKAIKAFNDRYERHAKNADIKGTPTFFFNDEPYGFAMTMADIDAAYAKALAKAK